MGDELELRSPDCTVDVSGETCPIPEMTTSRKLREMETGQVLEVLTDHEPAAEVTLPALCKGLGLPFAVRREGDLYKVKILKVK